MKPFSVHNHNKKVAFNDLLPHHESIIWIALVNGHVKIDWPCDIVVLNDGKYLRGVTNCGMFVTDAEGSRLSSWRVTHSRLFCVCLCWWTPVSSSPKSCSIYMPSEVRYQSNSAINLFE